MISIGEKKKKKMLDPSTTSKTFMSDYGLHMIPRRAKGTSPYATIVGV